MNKKILLSFFLLNIMFFSADLVAGYHFPSSYYTCLSGDIATKTMAEIEHECAKKAFKDDLESLNNHFSLLIKKLNLVVQKQNSESIRQKFLDEIEIQNNLQKEFNEFIYKYAESHSHMFLKTYPLHYYGSGLDLINLRREHIKLIIEELGS